MSTRPNYRNIVLLFMLYYAQGLPAGFQSSAFAVYLKVHGVPNEQLSFASALALPWFFKALWAPLVDRFGSTAFGRRKSWIAPLQLLLALSAGIAAFLRPENGLLPLVVLMLLMNLFAATQDIAVDGLAVDLLTHGELGTANAVQVVGYKFGILTAGGILVWATDRIGWKGLFLAMAALQLIVLAAILPIREAPPEALPRADGAPPEEERSLYNVVRTVVASALRAPGSVWLLLFIGTYKIGESMVDTMFKPFLIDAGFKVPQLGLWVSTYGLAASIVGSLAGGALASRSSLLGAVGITAVLRSCSIVGEWWLASMGVPPASAVIAVTVSEHLFGGALTTAMFAYMMSRVDKSVGATHYTFLASVEVLGKFPGGWISGALSRRLGYAPLFALGAALSFAFLLLLFPLRQKAPKAPEPARPQAA